jgi:hypothetical protein
VSWTFTGGKSIASEREDENSPNDGNEGHRTVNIVMMGETVCGGLDGTVGKLSREGRSGMTFQESLGLSIWSHDTLVL